MSTSTFQRKCETQELVGPASPPPQEGMFVLKSSWLLIRLFVCSLAADQGRSLLLGQKPGWGWEGLELQLSERSGNMETGLAPGGWEPGCSVRKLTVQVTLGTISLGAPSTVFGLVLTQ